MQVPPKIVPLTDFNWPLSHFILVPDLVAILMCLISSTLFLCIRKAGVTHRLQEHCSPHQYNEPNFEVHFGHKS